jgi:phage I-like protein
MPNDARITVVIGAAQIEDGGEQWIEVIPAVEEDRNGPFFFTITSDDLRTYAASIQEQPGLIPVDYDHAMTTGTVAAGWFTGETEIVAADTMNPAGDTQTHESLWARVKWTPRAMQEIRDGLYKRLSPEFTFVNRDAKTGLLTKAKQIVASTLTNRPHFKQLAAVGAEGDVVWDTESGYQSIRDDLSAALNPGPNNWRYCVIDVDVANSRALVEDTQEEKTYVMPYSQDADGEAQPAPSSDWIEAEQEWVSAAREAEERQTKGGSSAAKEGEEMSDLKALASALGLAEDATEEQIIAAAKAAKEKATPRKPDAALAAVREALGLDENAEEAAVIVAARAASEAAVRLDTADDELETLRGADAERNELKKRVKALEDERLAEKTKRILTEAIREGQVLPAEKAVLAKQFAGNPDGLLEIVATRPKRQFSAIGVGGGDGNDSESVRSVRQKFDSKEADGVDTESAVLHARAEQILTEQGKRVYTDLEYAEALELASVDA